MKRLLRSLFAVSLFSILLLAMLGCASGDGLTLFLLAAGRGVETVDSLDDIADEDIDDATVDDLSLALSEGVSHLAGEAEPTPAERIAAIWAIRSEIRTTHDEIVLSRAAVRTAFEHLKDDVARFRDSGQTLTEDDRIRVAELREELKTISASLRDSIGRPYKLMKSLRDRYERENLDLIYDTHVQVLGILDARLTSLDRIQAIFAELAAMLVLPEE